MTSKEALCRISFELGKANGVDVNDSEYISIIENDLEVLKIIKRHKTALKATNENGEIAFVDYSFSINHDDEDYEKVKRWLEGERK